MKTRMGKVDQDEKARHLPFNCLSGVKRGQVLGYQFETGFFQSELRSL